MKITCRGDHDWALSFADPFSKYSEPLMQCFSCGMVQRFYFSNWDGNVQICQQGWNLRPDKPFFDVSQTKKGYAG